MEQLKAKLKKQGGFTMVELLIVVAIIAVLVAVSIPMMNQALERSRHSVDQANVRDAVALAMGEYLVSQENAYGYYTYEVDSKTHAGSLSAVSATEPTTGGVGVQCQCPSASTLKGLWVKIEAPGTGEKVPKITTSWSNTSLDSATAAG